MGLLGRENQSEERPRLQRRLREGKKKEENREKERDTPGARSQAAASQT